jgi:hypothetical protein
MLGYTKTDLDEMSYFVGLAHDSSNNKQLREGLAKAYSFLQGLWAEGYFE